MSTTSRGRIVRKFVVLLAAMTVVLAACGDDDTTSPSTSTSSTSASTTTTEATTTTTTTEPATESVVRAYFLRGEKVGPVARDAVGSDVAADAIAGLLAGPDQTETQLGFSSTIPAGTTLLGLSVDGGVATVDLSQEFASGGGSLSMGGRVAQVVYTLTQFPTIDSVQFSIEGSPVTVLGGEGLMLDAPQTRADWEDFTPAILVESPLPFEAVTSPLHITGTANTFEAMFRVVVTDGDGLEVYDQPAKATSGTGTRGTFDETVEFEVPTPGVGSVIVWEPSPKDGSQTNLVEVPITVSQP